MHLPEPTFPPLLTGHGVSAPDRPFDVAVRRANEGRLTAGDLVWARDTDRLDCAIVLEPDVAGDQAAEMLFLTMVALGDAVGALAPPEVGVYYRWPGGIDVNGANAGRARLSIAQSPASDDPPPWMVVGLTLAIRATDRRTEPGESADRTTLHEEGCAEIDRTQLLESVSRHFLAWVDTWETEGFGSVHETWLGRCRDVGETVTVETRQGNVTGAFVGLDDHGNLLLRTETGVESVKTLDALSTDVEMAGLS